MKIAKLQVLVGTAVLSLGLASAGTAHAAAYAIAYNNLTNLTIVGAPGANIGLTLPSTLSVSSSASHSALGNINHPANGTNDVAPANLGTAKANNDFTPVGKGGNFSRGDAYIPLQQTRGDAFTQAINIAESSIDVPGTASAQGRNSSDTTFSVTINVTGPTTFTFDFLADPYLLVDLDAVPPPLTPSAARAELTVNINISDNNSGLQVFNWTPDGGAGGITGGIENADEASLNTSVTRNFGAPGVSTYDPTGDASIGDLTPAGGFKHYNAVTNDLVAGSYTLTLTARENTDITFNVPEPASIALMGLGLVGLARVRRRRQQGGVDA